MINYILRNKEGQIHVLIFIVLILLASLLIVTAQNITENNSFEIQPSIAVNETVETKVNETVSETVENVTEVVEEMPEVLLTNESIANLDIQISHVEKITRGEIFEAVATITNFGGLAKNVNIEWILPNEFELVSDNQKENCGDVGNTERCISTITVQPSLPTSLGQNEIKVEVSYE